MADTGAPWNLPYPLPTDLVRDGADAIKDLAEQVALGLDAAGNPGIGSNVVQTVMTAPFSTSSTSYTDVTGLTVTITPTSATSRVFVHVVCPVSVSAAQALFLTLSDGSNNVLLSPDSPGSRRVAFSRLSLADQGLIRPEVFTLVHSPGVDTAFTYKVRASVTGGTGYVNRGDSDSDTSTFARSVATITAIEVAP